MTFVDFILITSENSQHEDTQQFIKQIKSSAPFAETSPMLNDISVLHYWAKICSGLMRLFQGEVLGKFPVIQHLLFGSILHCSWPTTPQEAHIVGEHLHTVSHTDSGLTSAVPAGPSGKHVDLGHVKPHAGYVAQCVLEKPRKADIDPTIVPVEVVAALHVEK